MPVSHQSPYVLKRRTANSDDEVGVYETEFDALQAASRSVGDYLLLHHGRTDEVSARWMPHRHENGAWVVKEDLTPEESAARSEAIFRDRFDPALPEYE